MAGYCVRIDGLEYLLATAGITSLPTSSDDDWATDVTVLTASLDWPRDTISERAELLDGEVRVSGRTFRVFDVAPSSGSASGQPWVTYLLSRSISTIDQTVLTADTSISGTGDIEVDSTADFPASGVIWIDREAIAYTNVTGTEFTGITRGMYGSASKAHTLDTATGESPFVFGSIPSIEARRVTFWHVDNSNVATLLWVGLVGEAPVLNDDGATWQIQCDHIWTAEREMRPGIQATVVSPVGFNVGAISATLHYPGLSGWLALDQPRNAEDSIKPTLDEALDTATLYMRDLLVDRSINAVAAFKRTARGAAFDVTARVGQEIRIMFGLGHDYASDTSRQASEPRTAYAEIQAVPEAMVDLRHVDGVGATIVLDSIAGLPTSWSPETTADAPHTTSVQYQLIGDIDADTRLVLEPTATNAATGTLGPSITTTARVLARNSGHVIGNYRWLTHSPPLRLCARVTTTHWMRGIQYGVCAESDVLDSGIEERNWNFDNANEIVAATGAGPCERVWILDGGRTVRDLVCESLSFNAIGLGIKNGRVCPFVIRPPLASDTVAATFTSGDYTAKSSWRRNPDGIATTIAIDGGPSKLYAIDRMSTRRFLQQRTISVVLPESDDPRITRPDPRDLLNYAFGRVLSLWNQPTHVRTITVSLAYAASVWIGDYVSVTDWLTPNGSGGRGPSGEVCQVIGRELNLGEGTMTLEVLRFWQGTLYGYAPCVRIASISGTTVNVATAWTGGTSTPTDYAGSNLSTYSGTANDGGAGWFESQDLVKIVRRNVTSVTEETGHVVDTVSGTTIELQDAPITAVASASAEYDLVFDDYGNGASTTANMETFAWVGSYSTRVIGTSTDAARKWAP
jgi:hypothetical protein